MAYVGDTVIIECGSISVTKWTRDGITVYSYATGKALVLINVEEEQSGKYTCLGLDNEINMFTAEAEILVAGKLHDE